MMEYFERYLKAAKEVSARYRDQPLTPTETAVYWCEYVIRHKGASHLRSGGMNLGYIQYHNIDVFIILILATIITLIVSLKLTILCFRKVCRKRSDKKLKKTE